jgi:hypothetical protein
MWPSVLSMYEFFKVYASGKFFDGGAGTHKENGHPDAKHDVMLSSGLHAVHEFGYSIQRSLADLNTQVISVDFNLLIDPEKQPFVTEQYLRQAVTQVEFTLCVVPLARLLKYPLFWPACWDGARRGNNLTSEFPDPAARVICNVAGYLPENKLGLRIAQMRGVNEYIQIITVFHDFLIHQIDNLLRHIPERRHCWYSFVNPLGLYAYMRRARKKYVTISQVPVKMRANLIFYARKYGNVDLEDTDKAVNTELVRLLDAAAVLLKRIRAPDGSPLTPAQAYRQHCDRLYHQNKTEALFHFALWHPVLNPIFSGASDSIDV